MSVTWSEYRDDIAYLKLGGERPRGAYIALTELDLFSVLAEYDPVLAGTFPLGLELDETDLDLVCHAPDLEELAAVIEGVYGGYDDFEMKRGAENGSPTLVCHFRYREFRIGVTGQPAPSREQNAYRHLVAESRLLRLAGSSAADGIRRLKVAGLKTEPAFGEYFRLVGDPYQVLLDLADAPSEDLEEIITRSAHQRY